MRTPQLRYLFESLIPLDRYLRSKWYKFRGVKPSEFEYEMMAPQATYAPWLTDNEFRITYEKIKFNTLVDTYRCYELWQLIEQVSKLKEGALIEIGVWRGGTGVLTAVKAKLCGINHKFYLCDTFEGVVKAGSKDAIYKGGEHADTSQKIVEDLAHKFSLDNIQILKGIFPEDTASFVKEKSFRYVHIDVDVYQSAVDIVAWVWDKLVIGGVIVFDDYGIACCDGVTRFVNSQRAEENRIVIYNINGHAIIIKLK